MKLIAIALPLLAAASASWADPGGEIGYPQQSLGYDALVQANYAVAEKQILSDKRVAKDDPARLINLGQIYSQTGRTEEAIRVLNQAIAADEVELVLANGEAVSSRDAARKLLAMVKR